jgi:predicted RNase H-like HicB family nuclease
MNEVIFEVTQEADGGYVAECLTEPIITQGNTWDEIRKNVQEAASAYFFDQSQRPSMIRLHLVRDEVLMLP